MSSSSHQVAKVVSFSISPSNEYSGLISFRIDRFDRCYPRDSQESSLAPQFKSVSSSVFRLLYTGNEFCPGNSFTEESDFL